MAVAEIADNFDRATNPHPHPNPTDFEHEILADSITSLIFLNDTYKLFPLVTNACTVSEHK